MEPVRPGAEFEDTLPKDREIAWLRMHEFEVKRLGGGGFQALVWSYVLTAKLPPKQHKLCSRERSLFELSSVD